MLGHRFFHTGVLVRFDESLSDRNSDRVAGVRGGSCSVSSSSLRSSRASRGVCSVVLLEGNERADRDERMDLLEAGREVEPRVVSGVSMVNQKQRNSGNQGLKEMRC